MAQQVNRLTTIGVKNLTEPGMYADGAGLFLQVKGPTARSWIFRYMLQGKARWMGLGSAQTISLKEARDLRDAQRQKVKGGVDPIAIAKADVAAEKAAAAVKVITFADCVETYLADHDDSWRNAKHRQQWRNTLVTYAFETIGALPVASITAGHVIEILRPLWTEKHETARRLRGRIEAVLDYAADPDDLAYRNPAKLTPEQLKKKLPRLPASRRPQHHAAMPYARIGRFMAELGQREGAGARALEFLILTAARTGEVIGAKWSEIDLASATWTIPADRMKGGVEHRVPLSDAAIGVLDKMKQEREGELVFPGMKAGRPLSNMTLLAVLDRTGHGGVTGHGFRSSFRDWCGERGIPREVAEAALAHTIRDKSEAAYARSDLLERRRPVMAQWAQYCSEDLGTGNVVRMR
jgi:integrase